MSLNLTSSDSNPELSSYLSDASTSLNPVPPFFDSVLSNCISDDDNKSEVNEILKDSFDNAKEKVYASESVSLLQDISSTKDAEFLLKKNELSPSKSGDIESHSTWRKLTNGDGSYFWNVESGATQYDMPSEVKHFFSDNEPFNSLDSSLADLESAAFRYATLHISEDNSSEHNAQNSDCTVSGDVGRIFAVQSLGWLPLNHFSADPETSSVEVNACIQHLSSSHSKVTDGVGAWGEGKDMMLLIEDEDLKLLDPLSQTVLQSQPIKHIRVWGVGGNSPHDFAYVAKDKLTRQYKCHVFRCDTSAKAIAKELHNVCEKLSTHANKGANKDEDEKQKLAMSTSMPLPKSEPSSKFSVKYLGMQNVDNVNGIQTIRNVIREITSTDQALCIDAIAMVSASALVISSEQDSHELVNCRTRCLSFMGIGDDISLFAFINVVGNEAKCHILQCLPNAAKLAQAVQEACMLRFQKAVDAKPVTEINSPAQVTRNSFKRYFKNLFAKKTHT